MTTHVVCLDGTGQVKPQPNPTNISKIFDALGGTVVDGGNNSWETTSPAGSPDQVGKYIPGVGTQGNSILQWLGKGFGDGIAEQIVRGYTFLSRNYDPGDHLAIIGFSRGAAAARALAGFVAVQGLLDKTRYDSSDKDVSYLRAIAAWYLYRQHNPAYANQDRLTTVPDVAGAPPTLTDADFVKAQQVDAVGVFDTVSSLGLPQIGLDGKAIYDFNICDTVLNPVVARGFHALAADEIREVFGPTYWAPRQGIVQVIFPGAHSNVGGGYPETGLSNRALEWMLEQLASVGVDFPNPPSMATNALDIARDDSTSFPFTTLPKSARLFPDDAVPDVSIATRWGANTTILAADVVGPYTSQGTFAGGRPLHP